MRIGLLVVALAGVVLYGCQKSEVTNADAEKLKQEFSKDNYEKAMKEHGKGAELEQEKKAEQERGGR